MRWSSKNTNMFDYIRKNSKLSPNEMCAVLLGSQCALKITENIYWELDVPPKNRFTSVTRQYSLKRASLEKTCFLQITDTHIDDEYKIGTCAKCENILCCRANSGVCPNKSTAGEFGGYSCDLPESTFESALYDAAQKHRDAKFWLLSGDFCPHDIWETNPQDVMNHIERTWSLVRKYAKVKTFPVVVSHYFLLNRAGNYKEILDENTILLVVNSNFCARLNFWLFYEPKDAGQQLQWLIEELLYAERNGLKVQISMHIPPDNRECTEAWLLNYIKIIERFQDIIIGQYFGHTHYDEIRIVYSLTDEKIPVGVQYLTPALTTYSDTNPAYRKFCYANGSTSDIVTFYFDLKQQERLKGISEMWRPEYETLKEYELKDTSPWSWNEFYQDIQNNPRKRRLYL
ncbi:sphingomyelin phosphodiesterase-like protein 2, partial [Dinothrombium tinctorium]